jgi:hypothetical protein
VRHLVLPAERWHAIIGEGHPPAGILERRPDDVLYTGILGRLSHIPGLGQFPFRREVLPEIGDAVGHAGARKGALHARDVVDVGLGHFRARRGECIRLVRSDIAGEGSSREPT